MEWSFGESQIIEVVSPKESHITTITDSQEIKSFVDKLKIDKWKLEELPADTNKASEYVMYQKDTIHFGETSKNNTELNESAHIVTYEDIPYIDLKIKKFNMSFKVPGDVAKYLSDINS